MTAAELVGQMSYSEYLALERDSDSKHEYVNGQVYAMAGGSTEHARLALRLGAQLLQALGDRPCEVFNSDLRVRNRETGRSSYPDVTVICGRIEPAADDEQAATNPMLIAEVLSDTTESHDRGEQSAREGTGLSGEGRLSDRLRHYQRIDSLQIYLLISQTEPRVEVFRRVGDVWQYQAAGAGELLQLDEHGLSVDVDALYRSNLAR